MLEGKDDSELLENVPTRLVELIENPQKVPTSLMAEGMIGQNAYPDLDGYLDGLVLDSFAEVLPQRMLELGTNILNTDIGDLPAWQGKNLQGRFINFLGDRVILAYGVSKYLKILRGELQIEIETADRYRCFRKIAVAENGYVFSHEVERDRKEEYYLTLDTEGHWIKRSLGGEEPREFTATGKEDDGKIILAEGYGSQVANNFPEPYVWYSYSCLPVASMGDLAMDEHFHRIDRQMGLALHVYNILRAIHQRCEEAGLVQSPDYFEPHMEKMA